MVLDLLNEQPPGFVLARAGRLLHRDLEIAKLLLDFFARQHMQPARQNGSLDHGRLRAVEAFERGVARLEHHLAMEAWTLVVLLDLVHSQLGMGERSLEDGTGHKLGRLRGPGALVGQATREDEHVVGEAWKPYERQVENPGQTVSQKATDLQMAALG